MSSGIFKVGDIVRFRKGRILYRVIEVRGAVKVKSLASGKIVTTSERNLTRY